jgi:transcriptional regulator with XRE-family HTH domain
MKPEIKAIREKSGFSQELMAEKMKISQSAYARFELSKTKIDLKRLESFASVLGMDVVDVLTYPERYINVRDIGKEINNAGPEVIVQIRVKEKKREEILRMLFGDSDVEILKRD